MDEKTQKTLFNNEEEIQKKFSLLLQREKVIRDSVHGDIWITETEKDIIDTPRFQRLRGIKQLGPTDLVYPSARHTRFEHSIGTLYMAQQIIESINKNYDLGFSKTPLPPEDIFITRIVAVIHDLAHLPYGHTLENEGNLFGENTQWLDKDRRKEILNDILPIVKRHLNAKGIPEDKIKEILKDIEDILIAEEAGEDDIHKLKRPYIADIVGNTICADLLDYLKRDSYNTGLKMAYDRRILSYFVIHQYEKDGNKKPRVAILLERRKGKLREDILSYCLDLLRLRYSIAEKVYYHRVKVYFSAFIIKMVYCAIKGDILTKKDLMVLRDDELLYKIASYETNENDENEYIQAAKHLAHALLKRKKYCEIYSASYEKEEKMNMLKRYVDPEDRYQLERRLEDIYAFPPGTVVLYSPKVDKGKAAETKVIRGIFEKTPIIKKLEEMGKEPEFASTIDQEITTLGNRYKRLWKFYVLADSEWVEKRIKEGIREEMLKGACEETLNGKVGINILEIRDRINNLNMSIRQRDDALTVVTKAELDPREIRCENIDEILKKIAKGGT